MVTLDFAGPTHASPLSVLSRKRFSAAARALCMRIAQRETCREQVLLVEIQDSPVEQLEASRIDEDLGASRGFEDLIGLARRGVPLKYVAETRAAPGLYFDTKAATVKTVLLELP